MLIRRPRLVKVRARHVLAAVALLVSVTLGVTTAAHSAVPRSVDLISPNRLGGANNPSLPTVMVVGDSIPAELMNTINMEAKKRNLNLLPVAFGGCSVVGLYQLDQNNLPLNWSRRCTMAPRVQTQTINTYDPQIVIWYSGREKFTVCTVPTQDGCSASRIYISGSRAHRALIEKSMLESVKRLTRKGAKLVIVLPTPRGLTSSGSCASAPTASGCAQNPHDLAAFAWMEKAYSDLAVTFPMKVKTVTMGDLLCPDFDPTTGCPAAERRGELVRKDGVHIAPSQAKWFVRNLFNRVQATGLLR